MSAMKSSRKRLLVVAIALIVVLVAVAATQMGLAARSGAGEVDVRVPAATSSILIPRETPYYIDWGAADPCAGRSEVACEQDR